MVERKTKRATHTHSAVVSLLVLAEQDIKFTKVCFHGLYIPLSLCCVCTGSVCMMGGRGGRRDGSLEVLHSGPLAPL